MSYILSGDIGGTKTLLQLSAADKSRAPVLQKSYRSTDYAGLAEMLDEFLCVAGAPKIAAACLALPSAISGRRVKLTNLSWEVDADAIAARFAIAQIKLINDFEAAALGIAALQAPDLLILQTSTAQTHGVRLVVGAGTGLGVGWLTHNASGLGDEYSAHPSEGGHMDFAPSDALQSELLTSCQ